MTRLPASAIVPILLLAGCVAPAPERPPAAPPVATPAAMPRPSPPPPALATPASFLLEGVARQGGLLLGIAPPGTVRMMLDGAPVRLAADRRFVIAFDRDAAVRSVLSATLADGTTLTLPIGVAPRAWRIERLDRLAKVPVPSAAFAARRPAELARIVAARAIDGGSEGWRQRFVWPARGRISGVFGSQRIYRGEPGSYHGGVDVAAPTGTPVVAPADGVVVLAAATPFTLEGRLLIVDHGHGLNSAFLHLSRIDVAEGQRVDRGDTIGAIGATGRATGPHLHWGLTWRGARIDPAAVAGVKGP
ncbi:peptidase [Sphingomonas sp. Leaf412]|uniref:M23 family metallopeptidase n=1 Tax=Sphingomonas sp. Leaf412 TaxID=1736370 RepID=UPI0006F94DBE|nr:M23 family metallopeptidase [Sphingomonas sp. Leaf412]KQT32040.1 peptidase [Sphingomonas sp. Leaf412]